MLKSHIILNILIVISRPKKLIASLNLWLFFWHCIRFMYSGCSFLLPMHVIFIYCIDRSLRTVSCHILLVFSICRINLDIHIYIWSKKLVTFPSTTKVTCINAGGRAYGSHGQKPQPFILQSSGGNCRDNCTIDSHGGASCKDTISTCWNLLTKGYFLA